MSRTTRTLSWIAILSLIAVPAPSEEFLEAIVFPPTPVSSKSVGIEYQTWTGPSAGFTGGDQTGFYTGAHSSDSGGDWTERDSIFCLSYNRDHCSGARIVEDEHTFAWTWEASYQPTPEANMYIENNLNVKYADGQKHRPWAMRIDTVDKRWWLTLYNRTGVATIAFNKYGNTVVGKASHQNANKFEVWNGSSYFDEDVAVEGELRVKGETVLTGSGSHEYGPLTWALAGDTIGNGHEACNERDLACSRVMLPTGTDMKCNVEQPDGQYFFALCR